MKGMLRVALMLSLVSFSAASVEAAELDSPTVEPTREINVVNNFASPVRVYALDAEGDLHSLGNVARGQFKAFEISEEITSMGAVQIKIFPHEPARSLMSNTHAVRTGELNLESDEMVTVWLETDLANSKVEIRGF